MFYGETEKFDKLLDKSQESYLFERIEVFNFQTICSNFAFYFKVIT